MGKKLEFSVTVLLLCYTFVEGRKPDHEKTTTFGGHVDSRGFAQILEGRKLATKTTTGGNEGTGGGESSGASGGFGGGNGGGEVNGTGGDGGSSGCLIVGRGFASLCGKGPLFLLLIFVLVCLGVCIWCYSVRFRRGG